MVWIESSCTKAPTVSWRAEGDDIGPKTKVRPNNVQVPRREKAQFQKKSLTYWKQKGKALANGSFLGHVGDEIMSSAPCFLQGQGCPWQTGDGDEDGPGLGPPACRSLLPLWQTLNPWGSQAAYGVLRILCLCRNIGTRFMLQYFLLSTQNLLI